MSFSKAGLQYKDKPATMCVVDAVPVVMTGVCNSNTAPTRSLYNVRCVILIGNTTCVETRMDIPPEKKGSNHVKVDEGYTNRGNWNITSQPIIL